MTALGQPLRLGRMARAWPFTGVGSAESSCDSDSDEKLRLLAALSHTESVGTAHDGPVDIPHPKTP
ncbi:hypothetical protein SBI_00633 [Streptomyces bingchenggensis BCW-1]|uniref:Uncharacterized protein n=1 Tax=Streptomyces bingchenggensis (strain BCW-1) TaxID=749414 RepID=D7C2A0_STRBB|nr:MULTISPECIES: hypothetical protein [Streptomyces]ADI03754.1 hypothetical protein SBI_00633 [Streptomyces bingchenggensis BCW-1]